MGGELGRKKKKSTHYPFLQHYKALDNTMNFKLQLSKEMSTEFQHSTYNRCKFFTIEHSQGESWEIHEEKGEGSEGHR